MFKYLKNARRHVREQRRDYQEEMAAFMEEISMFTTQAIVAGIYETHLHATGTEMTDDEMEAAVGRAVEYANAQREQRKTAMAEMQEWLKNINRKG